MFFTIVRFVQTWKRYNASLRELSQLGDRELADIGITRSDIARVAWDSAPVAVALPELVLTVTFTADPATPGGIV